MSHQAASWFALGAGVLCLVASALDWNWFFANWRAKFFVEALGREGARLFYAFLGLTLLGIGFVMGGFA